MEKYIFATYDNNSKVECKGLNEYHAKQTAQLGCEYHLIERIIPGYQLNSDGTKTHFERHIQYDWFTGERTCINEI